MKTWVLIPPIIYAVVEKPLLERNHDCTKLVCWFRSLHLVLELVFKYFIAKFPHLRMRYNVCRNSMVTSVRLRPRYTSRKVGSL